MTDPMKRSMALLAGCLLLPALLVSPAIAEKSSWEKHPGFVDGDAFVQLVGEDAVTIEVSLYGSLLTAILKIDPELESMAGGLESIHAVIVEVEDGELAAKLLDLMRKTERDLIGKGWQRLVRIKEDGGEVKVLVLNDDESILGLAVLVAGDDHEFVFANIAGTINLAAIAKLGEKYDIPGLDELGNGD